MLRRTVPSLVKMGSDEVTHRARRVGPVPREHFAQHRMQVWQMRFKEVGPPFSRVWLALGGKMRRRRIGRSVDVKDQRYYWRPIEPSYQRLYQSKLRRLDHSNRNVGPMRLRASNTDVGAVISREEYAKNDVAKYARSQAGPKPFDFEFRAL